MRADPDVQAANARAEGGLGLHSASWACLCALVQLVQRALRVPHRPMTKRTNSGHLCMRIWEQGLCTRSCDHQQALEEPNKVDKIMQQIQKKTCALLLRAPTTTKNMQLLSLLNAIPTGAKEAETHKHKYARPWSLGGISCLLHSHIHQWGRREISWKN